jgi:hypothetical protein
VRCHGHDRRGVEQIIPDGESKIDRRDAADRASHRTDVEEIPDEDFSPQFRQALRTRIRRMHEGTNR